MKSLISTGPAAEWNLRGVRSGSYSQRMERGLSCAGRALICAAVLAACGRAPAGPAIPLKTTGPLPPGEPQVRATAVVISRKGKVELQRGPVGNWSDAQVGDRLAPSDALRTREGEAEVGVDGVKMRVHEASALRLKDANSRWLRAQVRGAVESEVEPGKGSLDVEVEGSDARAHSEGGHFFVTADGRGVVAVAAVTGSVNLASHGRQVEVKPGTVSRVAGGGPGPENASPALRRVLLAVRWPQERATSKDTVPVSGKVEAGSRVFIQGRPVPVEPGGSFRADVPLRDGKQTVAVVAIDPLGRRKQVDTTIVRDQTTPTVRVKRKLWQSR
jgi:Glucodextranase, domain B